MQSRRTDNQLNRSSILFNEVKQSYAMHLYILSHLQKSEYFTELFQSSFALKHRHSAEAWG